MGIVASCVSGTEGIGGLLGGVVAVCAPWDVNFDDMLDSHEFRRDGLCDGEGDFETPFMVGVLSEELLLLNPGLCGMGFECVGDSSCVW